MSCEREEFFKPISADDDQETTEVESLCMNCEQQGVTRLLLTKIPFFKEVIISSFECPHCGCKNCEVQSGGQIQDKGVTVTLKVVNSKDMNRQVVRSDWASLGIPELDFETPGNTQKGSLSTVEGVIQRVITGLEQEQTERSLRHPDLAEKVSQFIQRLKDLTDLKSEFHIVVDDPSGNSFIEPCGDLKRDEQLVMTHYRRNSEQNAMLGLSEEEEQASNRAEDAFDPKAEVVNFPTLCSNCHNPAQTHMKLTEIPYFKEVIVMCTVCDNCGVRTNEVKSGTGIEEKGIRYTLRLTDVSDLNRDVLKSDTATIEIPELELFLNSGTLGGKFTTIEGLLINIRDQLEEINPFSRGDSSAPGDDDKMQQLLVKLDALAKGEILPITFILDDPAGTSYLQNVYAPEPDPEMKTEHYERTFEQNDELGVNDMKTENYGEKEVLQDTNT